MSVVVFPHIATAIRRRRGGIYAVLAQHVAPVGQPRVVGPEPLGHGGREAHGSNDRQCGGGEQSGLHVIPLPDYALSSAIKAWYKTGTCGCFCGFERWRATRCNFKRGSARPSLLFFMEQRISAGRR